MPFHKCPKFALYAIFTFGKVYTLHCIIQAVRGKKNGFLYKARDPHTEAHATAAGLFYFVILLISLEGQRSQPLIRQNSLLEALLRLIQCIFAESRSHSP